MSSAAARRRIAGITITSMVVLASCGQDGDGDSFSSGRACRNVERLIQAVQADDPGTAGQELDRLTDDAEVEERIDATELEDVVDDPGARAGDAIEDAVSGLGCDLDVADVDITDSTTDPTTTDPTYPTTTDPTTDPTVTDPTTGQTGGTPFTLPPAPPPGTVPTTDPTTSGPSPSDPTSPPTTDRRGRVPLITVDVGAVESADVGEYDPRSVTELARQFGLDGLMVPSGRNEVDLIFVAHDFGSDPSRYDNLGFRFASDLSEREVLARFRDAVSAQGDYTIEKTDVGDVIGFDANPTDFEAQIPNWDVRVSPKDGRVHRLEIVRSEYNDDVGTRMRDIIVEQRRAELALLDELGWDVSGFDYYSSTVSPSSPAYESSDLTFVTSDAIVEAKDCLVGALGDGAEATEEDDFFTIETPEGRWHLSDYGAGVTGRFTSG